MSNGCPHHPSVGAYDWRRETYRSVVNAIRRYTAIVLSTVSGHVNPIDRCRPLLPSSSRALRSDNNCTAAAARPEGSRGSTTRAASPVTSRRAGALLVTTGLPHASASSAGRPKPSYEEGTRTTSPMLYKPGRSDSGTAWMKRIASRIPRSSASRSNVACRDGRGFGPATSKVTSGTARRMAGSARQMVSKFLRGSSLPT